MLIIPLTGKISKRNLPIVTIGIILINCFVFFALQSGDTEKYEQAFKFYVESGLAKIEISSYLDYLRTTQGVDKNIDFENPNQSNKTSMESQFFKMQQDDVFISKLLNDEIITPYEEIFDEWKGLRIKYETLLSTIFSIRFGFKPAQTTLFTFITYMFLHGSFMHILGNMIFLWLVGCALELGCGRPFYIGLYLVTGICAAGLFALVYPNSTAPLIGASGAISGLMGAFAVMYGKTKIRVFYSLGFYFNYAKITAIVLLPIWIANEILQLLFGAYTQIAYMAHIGGLTSGAALGYVNVKLLRRVDETVFEENPKEQIPALLEKALERIARIDMEGARPLLEKVLTIDQNNRDALTHLFNIDKLNPESELFFASASNLLQNLSVDHNAHEELLHTYQEYFRVSERPRLARDLSFNIASVFSAHGYLKEAELIIATFLKRHPTFQKLPTGLLNLARAYLKKGVSKKGKQCLRIICQRYPHSPESQIARSLLVGPN
jgi:membrane associated rhomboid family serine protease